MAASFADVWKIESDALAYPNAEVIRKALVNLLPADAIVLVSHDTFGMDLAPGLSIKLDSAFIADVVDIEGFDGTTGTEQELIVESRGLEGHPGEFGAAYRGAVEGGVDPRVLEALANDVVLELLQDLVPGHKLGLHHRFRLAFLHARNRYPPVKSRPVRVRRQVCVKFSIPVLSDLPLLRTGQHRMTGRRMRNNVLRTRPGAPAATAQRRREV